MEYSGKKKMNIIFDNNRHMEKSQDDELKLELPVLLDISHARFSLELKENNNDYISKIENQDILIATGTSCRRQILDVFTIQTQHLPQLFAKSVR